jgi:Family of unknown function (DUF5330)
MGMLRTIIIVGAAIALMPTPPPEERGALAPSGPGTFAYMAAAAETVADMRSFCQRNPNVCHTAGALAVTLEGKAKYSAKLVYEWANEATGDTHPSALPANLAAADDEADDSTLTVADLAVPFRKPTVLPKS